LLIMFSLLLSLSLPQAPRPCTAAEYRQFDFWVGRWEVTDKDGKKAGTNDIQRVHGGCALAENWTSAEGTTGSSLNMYVAATKVWHQTWADSGGTLLVMEGGLRDGAMHMSGAAYSPRGGKLLSRITWTPNADGSVRQFWEASRDEGKTWMVVFDGTYVRMK
jgi:hypothetical protein